MTTVDDAGPRPKRWWDLAVVPAVILMSAALVAGGMALGKPGLAPAVWVAVVVVPVLLGRPRLLLALLVVAEIANLGAFTEQHGIPNLFMALVVLGGCVIGFRWLQRGVRPTWSALFGAVLVFFVVRVGSSLAATDFAAAAGASTALLRDVIVLAVLVTLCVNLEAERLLAATAVITAAALCGLEVLQQLAVGNATTFGGLLRPATIVDVGLSVPRHTGPVADFNFWGRILLMMVPLALALFGDRSAGRRRWWWLLAAALLVAGIYLTGSRGAFLSLGIVVLVWLLVSGRRYRRLLLLTPLSTLVLLVPGVGTRIASALDTATTATSVEDASLTGRINAIKVGWYMTRDHPLTGVGIGNFGTRFADYQRLYGIDGPSLAPHNLYLEMSAESGIPGLLAWLVFFGIGLLLALRARALLGWLDTGREPSGTTLLAGGAVAAITGWAVVSIVLHIDNLQILAIPMTIAASLDLAARRRVTQRLGIERWSPDALVAIARQVARPPRVKFGRPLAIFVVVTVAGMAVPGIVTSDWSTTAEVQVIAAPGRQLDAYGLEVLSRRPLDSTYLAALTTPAAVSAGRAAAAATGADPGRVTFGVSTSSDPTDLSLTANGPTPQAVQAGVVAATQTGTDLMNRGGPLYLLRPVGFSPPSTTRHVATQAIGLVLLAAIGAAVADTALRRRSRRRKGPGSGPSEPVPRASVRPDAEAATPLRV